LGTLRTALFSWLFARHNNGVFVLRIEDTDLARSEAHYEDSITEGLNWMGITVDEGPDQGGSFGPYRQSDRSSQGLYQKAADYLLEKNLAYYCFCTPEELEAERAAAQEAHKPYVYSRKALSLTKEEVTANLKNNLPYVIRFKMPDNPALTFTDLIRHDITFDLNLISDFVLLKSDGTPSYNFACVVDDIAMNITHVIRGEDHISNTPKQIVLYHAFEKPVPEFGHLPMILGSDKSKLSKRHGATNVIEYRDLGYLPDAMFNYMSLLGWSSPDDREILTRNDIISLFSLDRVSKSGAVFDLTKLKWMNGQYIRQLSPEALLNEVKPFLSEATQSILEKSYTPKQQLDMVYSVRDNLDVLTDIENYLTCYTDSDKIYAEKRAQFTFSETDNDVIKKLSENLKTTPQITPEKVTAILEKILAETQLPKGKVFKPIRLACTAIGSGPSLDHIISILGTEKIIKRIESLLHS
jgi:nondiscriminating glutamyl-tRNA synthetase